jgi:hypothetical protein
LATHRAVTVMKMTINLQCRERHRKFPIVTVGFNLLLLWVLNGNNVRHCIGQIFKVHLGERFDFSIQSL